MCHALEHSLPRAVLTESMKAVITPKNSSGLHLTAQDVGGVSPVPVQMWQGRALSRCRCGRGGPCPGADVGGVSPVPVQMWAG
jgi:hypothetical protein